MAEEEMIWDELRDADGTTLVKADMPSPAADIGVHGAGVDGAELTTLSAPDIAASSSCISTDRSLISRTGTASCGRYLAASTGTLHVFSYSSRLSVVAGGTLKLYGESLLRWRSLKRVLRNQCLITFGGSPDFSAMPRICSSLGELLMSKCARSIFSCSSLMRVRARLFCCAIDSAAAAADCCCCCCCCCDARNIGSIISMPGSPNISEPSDIMMGMSGGAMFMDNDIPIGIMLNIGMGIMDEVWAMLARLAARLDVTAFCVFSAACCAAVALATSFAVSAAAAATASVMAAACATCCFFSYCSRNVSLNCSTYLMGTMS
ncbi:hypothetical protein NP493_11g11039 [Ridgeia piscesae]|uniref:Uncharacterized protein n=1 Tax=Ridgeia piscesae TaxID=27915 RepID=A0AAD9PF40_RIDPI|nr:hypothetical protein NP493_11g11039 [Ridgeia piscesae]